MSYEYNSESKTLELPNPYRFQNKIMLVCSCVLFLSGVWSLFNVKNAIGVGSGIDVLNHRIQSNWEFALVPLVLSVVLLLLAVYLATTALGRLRFYFGRNKPVSLAPDLAKQTMGTSYQAAQLAEILRQRALVYSEPIGTMANLLYHRFPGLITAPPVVQRLAQLHFMNLAAMLATLVSFCIAWGWMGDDTSRPWIGLLYLCFGSYFLLRPVVQNQASPITTNKLVALVVVAILAPVLLKTIAPHLPNLHGLAFHTQVFTLLMGTVLGVTCIFMASLSQMRDETPPTQVSSTLSRQAMQNPPSSLFDELQRVLQESWTEQIPNRRYSLIEPQTPLTQAGGAFTGELLEETQPMAMLQQQATTLQQLWADKSRRFLLLTDVFAALILLVSVILTLQFLVNVANPNANVLNTTISTTTLPTLFEQLQQLSTAFVLACIALSCFKNSAALWGRFDFVSNLIAVQVQGAYQMSKIGTGNTLSSAMQTQNDMVRVEGMTLNIWRARIETVVFGQGLGKEVRHILAMHSVDAENDALHQHLQQFIAQQSVLAAPQSNTDAKKMQNLFASADGFVHAAMDKLGNLSDLVNLTQNKTKNQTADTNANPMIGFCTGCGAGLPNQANFCGTCGQSV